MGPQPAGTLEWKGHTALVFRDDKTGQYHTEIWGEGMDDCMFTLEKQVVQHELPHLIRAYSSGYNCGIIYGRRETESKIAYVVGLLANPVIERVLDTWGPYE